VPVFTIYYGDGSVYTGLPEMAPPENVQAIAWDDENGPDSIGRVVLSEWDFYLYSDGIGWHGANKYADLLRHLKKRPCVVLSQSAKSESYCPAMSPLVRAAPLLFPTLSPKNE